METNDGIQRNDNYDISGVELNGRLPSGPIGDAWDRSRFEMNLIAPANRRKYRILVVGSGLSGASAAATLGEMGYQVSCFCYQDSPRRAHSVCAQGGINAAKNYRNDGDSIHRLFEDTIKGGDFRSREANVYRLAQISLDIIDQCVAQGVPFSRDYAGLLETRSFGGAQVSRTFYVRGQTGQQLQLAAYQALSRQIGLGQVKMFPRMEMLDLVVVDGRARGIVTRDLVSGEIVPHAGDAVVLATGGYSNVFYLSTNSKGCNSTAIWCAYKRGALLANPCFTQIHPTCIPLSGDYQGKLTLMSESLRNDGRMWVPKRTGDNRRPGEIPERERDYFLERMYPSFGNLAPRDIASRAAKQVCDQGQGVGPGGKGVYLDFTNALRRIGVETIRDRYGNLFDMYERITAVNPYEEPMCIYPAPHYTMGGLWVDYHLMSSVPGLFVIGEANFSDHGANRLGASALMQGLADGYFILPATMADYLAPLPPGPLSTAHASFNESERLVQERIKKLLSRRGKRTPDSFHRELGRLLWNECGLSRSEAGLKKGLAGVRALREQFWENVRVTGGPRKLNPALEKAGRVANFLELAELICIDALHRMESCGAHFREESQTPEGEALRDDERFSYVGAWKFMGMEKKPMLFKEPLVFKQVKLERRSYK